MNITISTAKWKYAKQWVYSATYDEALAELHQYVIPHHTEFGIPGHLEVVSGHIGKQRQIGASSYNGFHHMSGVQLREMLAYGWGVGCHSWSHETVADDPETELLKAREVLEDAIGRAVTIYVAPGSNANMVPVVIAKAKEYGYLAAMGITDNLNYADSDVEDLFILNRPALHEKMSDLYDRAFDPFNRIQQAKKYNGWIADYLHCPQEKAVHDYKDCSAAHHYERLATIAQEGKYDCWFANPDDVVDYRYMRRYCQLNPDPTCENAWSVSLTNLPQRVMNRELTFLLHTPLSPEHLNVQVDQTFILPYPLASHMLSFTAKVNHGSRIVLTPHS